VTGLAAVASYDLAATVLPYAVLHGTDRPAWIDGRNAAGFLANLALVLVRTRRPAHAISRAAKLVIRLAKKTELTKWEQRDAAQHLGQLIGTPLPAQSLDVPWALRRAPMLDDLPALVQYTLTAAASLVLFPERLKASTSLLRYVHESMHAAGVRVNDIEVRWRIRDWIGRVANYIPPRVRQAASAAWMVGHFQLARTMVEGYVEDWLAEEP